MKGYTTTGVVFFMRLFVFVSLYVILTIKPYKKSCQTNPLTGFFAESLYIRFMYLYIFFKVIIFDKVYIYLAFLLIKYILFIAMCL